MSAKTKRCHHQKYRRAFQWVLCCEQITCKLQKTILVFVIPTYTLKNTITYNLSKVLLLYISLNGSVSQHIVIVPLTVHKKISKLGHWRKTILAVVVGCVWKAEKHEILQYCPLKVTRNILSVPHFVRLCFLVGSKKQLSDFSSSLVLIYGCC